MAAQRWLAFPILVALGAMAFASCSSEATTTGTGGSSATSTTTGVGGATSTTATTSTTGAGGDSGPPAPTCKNKSYSNIPKGQCDLFDQDCGPAETCKPVADGATFTTQCLPAFGLKSEGETCYDDAECLGKLQCIGAHCSPICCSNTNVPCASGRCGLQLSFGGALFMQGCIYSTACELFAPNACEIGFQCQVDPVQGLPACVPPSGSVSPELGPCTFLNDCGNMQQCIFPAGKNKGRCHYLCYLKQETPTPAGQGGCPAGETCLTHDGPIQIAFDLPNIGICVPDAVPPDAGSDAAIPEAGPDADPPDADPPDADPPDADVPDAP